MDGIMDEREHPSAGSDREVIDTAVQSVIAQSGPA